MAVCFYQLLSQPFQYASVYGKCRRKCGGKLLLLFCVCKILSRQRLFIFFLKKKNHFVIFHILKTFKITKSAFANSVACVISFYVQCTVSHLLPSLKMLLASMYQAKATRAEPVYVESALKLRTFLTNIWANVALEWVLFLQTAKWHENGKHVNVSIYFHQEWMRFLILTFCLILKVIFCYIVLLSLLNVHFFLLFFQFPKVCHLVHFTVYIIIFVAVVAVVVVVAFQLIFFTEKRFRVSRISFLKK